MTKNSGFRSRIFGGWLHGVSLQAYKRPPKERLAKFSPSLKVQ